MPMLEDLGVVTWVDGNELERYVVQLLQWRTCQAHIAKHGMTYAVISDAPAGYVVRQANGSAVVAFVEWPQVREAHRLDKSLKQIEDRFGLSPSARARLTTDRPQLTVTDGKARFFQAPASG